MQLALHALKGCVGSRRDGGTRLGCMAVSRRVFPCICMWGRWGIRVGSTDERGRAGGPPTLMDSRGVRLAMVKNLRGLEVRGGSPTAWPVLPLEAPFERWVGDRCLDYAREGSSWA